MVSLFDWFHRSHRPKTPRGLHFGQAATLWAEPRFTPELRPVAAYVAETLCEQVGLTLSQLEPHSIFLTDLQIDEETPELVMALEEDLGFSIPDADCRELNTISDLVCYLHARLQSAGNLAI